MNCWAAERFPRMMYSRYEGMPTAANIATITTTIINSSNVKPAARTGELHNALLDGVMPWFLFDGGMVVGERVNRQNPPINAPKAGTSGSLAVESVSRHLKCNLILAPG